MNKNIIALILLIFILASCSTVKEEDVLSFEKSSLFGMIYDYDNCPVPAAEITVDGDKVPATDINGRFIIPNLTRGSHLIVVKKDGYEEFSERIDFLNKTQVLYLKIPSVKQLIDIMDSAIESMEWSLAEETIKRIETVDENDAIFIYFKTVFLYRTKCYEEAVKSLLELDQLGYKEAYIYIFLADIYQYNLNNNKAAKENLEKYLKLKNGPEAEKRLNAINELLAVS